ncbi:MAG: hypothetical protein K0R66_817 [Gammaproteobacteria bacterium]|jgi:hypothetical protein|nr:hypothetical protein [Gammaproteobacteria bacterium]
MWAFRTLTAVLALLSTGLIPKVDSYCIPEEEESNDSDLRYQLQEFFGTDNFIHCEDFSMVLVKFSSDIPVEAIRSHYFKMQNLTGFIFLNDPAVDNEVDFHWRPSRLKNVLDEVLQTPQTCPMSFEDRMSADLTRVLGCPVTFKDKFHQITSNEFELHFEPDSSEEALNSYAKSLKDLDIGISNRRANVFDIYGSYIRLEEALEAALAKVGQMVCPISEEDRRVYLLQALLGTKGFTLKERPIKFGEDPSSFYCLGYVLSFDSASEEELQAMAVKLARVKEFVALLELEGRGIVIFNQNVLSQDFSAELMCKISTNSSTPWFWMRQKSQNPTAEVVYVKTP